MTQTVADPLLTISAGPVELPAVVVVSPDGSLPPSRTPFAPRAVVTDLSSVQPSDDVVVLYGDRSADDVSRLHQALGRSMPAVLVAARVFDQEDVIGAFDRGASSYLIMDAGFPYCLVDAIRRTAAGETFVSPCVAVALMRHVSKAEPAPSRAPADSGILTARERQVMELLVVGHTIVEIARHLRLTQKTVRNNLSNIYAKLQVRRQSEAILLWLGHQRTPVSEREQAVAPGHDERLAPTG